jgi:hypothetical protein
VEDLLGNRKPNVVRNGSFSTFDNVAELKLDRTRSRCSASVNKNNAATRFVPGAKRSV